MSFKGSGTLLGFYFQMRIGKFSLITSTELREGTQAGAIDGIIAFSGAVVTP